jgi:hypothetical protein
MISSSAPRSSIWVVDHGVGLTLHNTGVLVPNNGCGANSPTKSETGQKDASMERHFCHCGQLDQVLIGRVPTSFEACMGT